VFIITVRGISVTLSVDLFHKKGYNEFRKEYVCMSNRNRIITMAKMAVYDKRYGSADRAAFSFYRRDYIYRKNMWTRFSVGIGSLFLLAAYWLHEIFIYGADIQELDIYQSVTNSLLFLIAVMAFYTMIGTIQGTIEYYKVQRRMEDYIDMIEYLEDPYDFESNDDVPVYFYEEN